MVLTSWIRIFFLISFHLLLFWTNSIHGTVESTSNELHSLFIIKQRKKNVQKYAIFLNFKLYNKCVHIFVLIVYNFLLQIQLVFLFTIHLIHWPHGITALIQILSTIKKKQNYLYTFWNLSSKSVNNNRKWKTTHTLQNSDNKGILLQFFFLLLFNMLFNAIISCCGLN